MTRPMPLSRTIRPVRIGSASPSVPLAALAAFAFAGPLQAQVVSAAAGPNAAAIQGAIDAFRSTLGSLNANVPGSFASGRREINWDGVPDGFAASNPFPANFFNANSPRGAVFTTPGSGFQVSAGSASGVPVEFGNLNPSYPSLFATFSAPRLFTALDSTVLDVGFFVPGSAAAALTRGFGVVFTDVDLANTTSLSFYGAANQLLDTFFVPAAAGNETLSFLGVDYGAATVSRVRVTSGNLAVGGNEGSGTDVVVMDDFVYGEPIAVAAIPEPGVAALLLGGLGLIGWKMRRRRGAAATHG